MNNHEPPTSGLASVLDLVARELVAARTAPANTPRPQAAPQQPRHGITTIGDFGYRFRSRLEARWAHMFTTLNWDWEYEPVDLRSTALCPPALSLTISAGIGPA